MKINNFQGELTNISAKKEAMQVTYPKAIHLCIKKLNGEITGPKYPENMRRNMTTK